MKLFRKEPEKQPFSYGAIIEQRKSPDRLPWIIGIGLFLIILAVIYFLMLR